MKLLLVDDDAITLDGLKNGIDWAGLGISRVELASNGRQALEIAERYRPDLVVTDVSMPKMNGIELSRELALRYPQTKILFVSGYLEVDYMKAAFKSGGCSNSRGVILRKHSSSRPRITHKKIRSSRRSSGSSRSATTKSS